MTAYILLPSMVLAFMAVVLYSAAQGVTGSVADVAARWRALTSQERMASAAIIVALATFVYAIGVGRKDAHFEVLRRQFLLPDDVAASSIRVAKGSSVARPRVEAIVRLSEQQYRAYAAAIADGRWRPFFLTYGGSPVRSFSAEALRWNEAPQPAYAGERRVRWGGLSHNEAQSMSNGRVMCFALQRQTGEPSAAFTARACGEIGRRESVTAYVLGLLDDDTRTLHMVID